MECLQNGPFSDQRNCEEVRVFVSSSLEKLSLCINVWFEYEKSRSGFFSWVKVGDFETFDWIGKSGLWNA